MIGVASSKVLNISDPIQEDALRALRQGVLFVSQRICLSSLRILSLLILLEI